MTKTNIRTRIDAMSSVGDLSRLSVKQDEQINDLINRLTDAAIAIRSAQDDATGSRKLAERFCQQRNSMAARIDDLQQQVRDLVNELERARYERRTHPR